MMKTCESCKSMKRYGGHGFECYKGVTIRGSDPTHPFGCTLHESKPVEFEGELYPLASAIGSVWVPVPTHLATEAEAGRKVHVTLRYIAEGPEGGKKEWEPGDCPHCGRKLERGGDE